MLSHRSFVVIGCVLMALVAAPAAEAQAAKQKPRLASLRSVPAKVEAGRRFRVRGRVTHLPKHKAVRVTFTLRKSGRAIALRTVKVRRTKRSSSRRFSARIRVPAFVRAGGYRFRACVRKSCRSKRLRVTDKPVPGPGPVPQPPHGPAPLAANHSLRAPLTGENFYFVMADRFFNGDTATTTAASRAGRASTASTRPARAATTAATSTACGRSSATSRASARPRSGSPRASRTRRCRTTTASPPPATTATGSPTSPRSTRTSAPTPSWTTLIQAAHARGMKVFFDIITNHTADVISYEEGDSARRTSRRTRGRTRPPRARRSTTATSPAPIASRRWTRPTSFPYQPCVPAAERTSRSRPGSTT